MDLSKSSTLIDFNPSTPFLDISGAMSSRSPLQHHLQATTYDQTLPLMTPSPIESFSAANSSKIMPLNDEILTRIEVLVLIVLFISTLVGNISVIIILLFFNSKSKKTCCNNVSRMSFYIINLSFADISVAMLSILPQIIWRYSILFWASSQFICKSVTYGQVFSVYASTFVLIAMAYDRYKCICQPMTSCSWSYRGASVGIIIAWVAAALVSSPQLFLYRVQEVNVQNTTHKTCYVLWEKKEHEFSYILFHASTQFFIPLIVLSVFYTKIFLAVSQNIRFKNASVKIETSTSKTEGTQSMNDINAGVSGCQTPRKSLRFSSPAIKRTYRNSEDSFEIGMGRKQSLPMRFISSIRSKSIFSTATTRTRETDANEVHPMILKNLSYSPNRANTYANLQTEVAAATPTSSAKKRVSKNSFNSVVANIPIRQNWSVKTLSKSKIKTLKLTVTVVIAYILCSLPFYLAVITNFYLNDYLQSKLLNHSELSSRIMHYILIITTLLFQLNSCANPLIYMVFNGNAKKIIKKRFTKRGPNEGSLITDQTMPSETGTLRRNMSSASNTDSKRLSVTTINRLDNSKENLKRNSFL